MKVSHEERFISPSTDVLFFLRRSAERAREQSESASASAGRESERTAGARKI